MRVLLSNLLIPFGIHRNTGVFINPEDALSGRECCCICPGCGAPLIGVHSTTKRWHFAHDSRHELFNPLQECNLSPQVALAMMIRHQALNCVGEAFDLPSLELRFEGCYPCGCHAFIREEVTPENTISIDAIDKYASNEGHVYDLRIQVQGKFIYVVLQYDTKDDKEGIDLTPYYESKSGLLAIDCDYLVDVISGMYEDGEKYGDGVKAIFLRNVAKHWICHPRTELLVKSHISKHVCGFSGPLAAAQFTRKPATASCAMCQSNWPLDPDKPLNCVKCNTHLYVTVQLDG